MKLNVLLSLINKAGLFEDSIFWGFSSLNNQFKVG